MENTKKFDVVTLLKIFIPIIIAVAIAIITPPTDLTVESMRFAGIFICLIIWMVLDVFPDFVITLVGLSAFVIFGVCKFGDAFAPFGGSSVWLVIGAFGLSAGVAKSGLLKRLSFMVLKVFPENFRGQVTALFATGLIISPLIPSLNAKAAILGPFSAQVSESLNYKKGSKGARGLFGAMVISTTILGMAFYSGAVPVFTLIGMMPEELRGDVTWMSWFSGTWLWLIAMLGLCFLAIIVLYKPTDEVATAEKGLAKKQLDALGPTTTKEKIAGVLLAAGLLGWMTTKITGIDATLVSLIVLLLMFITGILASSDFKNSIAWSSVVFIGCIYSLASLISKMGWSTYLAKVSCSRISTCRRQHLGPHSRHLLGCLRHAYCRCVSDSSYNDYLRHLRRYLHRVWHSPLAHPVRWLLLHPGLALSSKQRDLRYGSRFY